MEHERGRRGARTISRLHPLPVNILRRVARDYATREIAYLTVTGC